MRGRGVEKSLRVTGIVSRRRLHGGGEWVVLDSESSGTKGLVSGLGTYR